MKHDSINKSSQRLLSDVIRKIISTESIDEAFRDILTDTLRCYSAGRVVGLHILDRNLNLIYKMWVCRNNSAHPLKEKSVGIDYPTMNEIRNGYINSMGHPIRHGLCNPY